MGRRALSEEEKLQRAKEKETQRELYEKQYNDFSNAKLCDLVDASILRMFYMKCKNNEELSEAQLLGMIVEAFNNDIIKLKIETKVEYSIGIK